jgi:tRNA (mo5U34)-methyltransferase
VTKDAELVHRIEEWTWFHTIDLGDGLVTRGNPPSAIIEAAFPEVRGRSVLDIGAWDGKYSFQAEQRGAERVVALDHYVWRLDHVGRQRYYDECEANGTLPDPDLIDRGFLMEGLYGRSGFDMAKEYLDSEVEPVVDDFMSMDLAGLGAFDVVLYFGVLYHMVDPVSALRRLRQVTAGVAVIETAAIHVPGYEHESLTGFFAGNELHADYGNWFAPNVTALEGMCRAAGFGRVELKAHEPLPIAQDSAVGGAGPSTGRSWRRRRALRRSSAAPARPSAPPPAPPPMSHYRIVVHAWPA